MNLCRGDLRKIYFANTLNESPRLAFYHVICVGHCVIFPSVGPKLVEIRRVPMSLVFEFFTVGWPVGIYSTVGWAVGISYN